MAKNDLRSYSLEQLKAIVEQFDDDRLSDPPFERFEDLSWASARLPAPPPGKTSVHLRVDSDVLQWFRDQGKGHLTRMNAVLRAYMEANRRRSR